MRIICAEKPLSHKSEFKQFLLKACEFAEETPHEIVNVVVKNCTVKRLPQILEFPRNILALDASYNLIKVYVANTNWLQKLDLSHNQIKTLPKELLRHNTLRVLDLSYNLIDALPKFRRMHTKIRELNLQHNLIKAIPDNFRTWRALRDIMFYGNPFENQKIPLLLSISHLLMPSQDAVEIAQKIVESREACEMKFIEAFYHVEKPEAGHIDALNQCRSLAYVYSRRR